MGEGQENQGGDNIKYGVYPGNGQGGNGQAGDGEVEDGVKPIESDQANHGANEVEAHVYRCHSAGISIGANGG